MVLSKAGDHVPVILLSDVVGNAAKGSPAQIGATGVNMGVIGVSQVVTLNTKSIPGKKVIPSDAFPSV